MQESFGGDSVVLGIVSLWMKRVRLRVSRSAQQSVRQTKQQKSLLLSLYPPQKKIADAKNKRMCDGIFKCAPFEDGCTGLTQKDKTV